MINKIRNSLKEFNSKYGVAGALFISFVTFTGAILYSMFISYCKLVELSNKNQSNEPICIIRDISNLELKGIDNFTLFSKYFSSDK